MRRVTAVFFFVITVSLSSCASLITGRHDQVSFSSSPDGATVAIGGRPIGKTPLVVDLKKEAGQTLTFEKEGFKPTTMDLGTRVNPWFWGNIIFGGLPGSTTDALAGSVYEYRPNQYMATLEPTSVTMPIQAATERTNSQKIKEFIVLGYRPLLTDLKAGHGEYVSSLLDLMNTPKNKREETTRNLYALSTIYPSIPEFADRVNDLAIATPATDADADDLPAVKALPTSQP